MKSLNGSEEEVKEFLSDVAKLYKDMTGTYLIKVSDRKGKGKELTVVLGKENFLHLCGVGKSTNFEQVSSRKCLKRFLNNEISGKEIEDLSQISETKERLENFYLIKEMLSVGGEIRERKTNNSSSKIKGEYLLTKKIESGGYAHLFLKKTKSGDYVPETFIVHRNRKYLDECGNARKILWVKELPSDGEKDMLLKTACTNGKSLAENCGVNG